MKSKAMSFDFQSKFFNGDTATDVNGFDGLTKLATAASRNNTAATVLNLADLDSLMMQVGQSSALFMNAATILKVQALLRAEKLALPDIDMVGNRVQTYNGVPIIRADAYNGANVLADGEIYSVRLGADGVFGVQNSAPEVKIYEPSGERPAWTARIEWYAAIALGTTDSVYRIKRNLV